MTIEKLSPKKLQVLISRDDMQEWEIEPETLTYNSPEAQMLFNDVIMQARLECDFICDGANVVIEAVPDKAGLKVLLTVIEDTAGPMQPSTSSIISERSTKPKTIILELTDINDVTSACKHLLPIYHGQSHLFKYQGRYYIVLQANNISQINIFDLGEIVDNPDLFFGYLNEYAEAIVRNDFLASK
ncbi:MAG: adaptor protein MecA [Clostridiales bacterium]|jgi:adapter protein MecA 1/2|nr:adaptor protein MecA [Clostridiales bacterium]